MAIKMPPDQRSLGDERTKAALDFDFDFDAPTPTPVIHTYMFDLWKQCEYVIESVRHLR